MNMAHIKNLDLNLLIVLECLYRHRNVSGVAQEVGLTQSAISHALTRLRDHYKDPLFVRVSKGVEPTEFALSIKKEVEEFVARATLLAEKLESFDPKKAEGRIVISTTDYFEIVIGNRLFERVQQEAPNIQLSFRPTLGSLPKAQLEDGTYDVAIAGFYQEMPEGFYRQKLMTDTFSTAYRKDHSKIRGKIKADHFFDYDHALITLQGDFKDSFTQVIAGKKKGRLIKYGTASFTAPAWLLAETDLVLTGPTSLLEKYQEHFPIHVQPCPIDVKPIEIQMVWHGLTHQNPLKKWVRQVIKEICTV